MSKVTAMQLIAEKFDDELARLYIAVTVEALAFDVALVGVLLFYMGVSSFSILQSIGVTLFVFVVGSTVLHFRKKRMCIRICSELKANDCEDDEWHAFLSSKPVEFEFVRALFIPVAGGKSASEKP